MSEVATDGRHKSGTGSGGKLTQPGEKDGTRARSPASESERLVWRSLVECVSSQERSFPNSSVPF